MYRVLMIAPTPFFADRGCHVRILGEARALERLGCDVLVCTYHNGRDMPDIRSARIPPIPWYRKLEAGPSLHKYYLDVLLYLRSLQAALRFRPDVVHAHLHEGAFLGRLLGMLIRRPVLFDYQGSLTDELTAHGFIDDDGLTFRAMQALEGWIERAADVIVPSTGRAAASLRTRFPPEKIMPVDDSVDTSDFRPVSDDVRRELRRRYGIPQERVVGLYLGVLAPYQGTDLLLDHASVALEAAPDLHLVIVGFPEEEYRERAEAMGLADRVVFTGKVPFEETRHLLAAADLALTPKVSVTEGNLKVYYYMASGLPVVAFDNPVNRDILADLGIYADPGDGAAFMAEVARLANDPVRRADLSRAVRQRAESRFSWKESAEKILEAYASIGADAFAPRRAAPPSAAT